MTIPKCKGLDCQSLCRLCGKRSRKGTQIFKDKVSLERSKANNKSSGELQLSGLIFDCLHFRVTEDDLLPKLVCCDCEKKLTSWWSFFIKSKETQENLLKTLSAGTVTEEKKQQNSKKKSLCETDSIANFSQKNESKELKSLKKDTKEAKVEAPVQKEKNNKEPEDSAPYTHTCPVCKKSFSKRAKFAQHLASHVKPDAESPHLWPCPVCPKKLRSCDGLARHQETHLESRNYCCHVCGRLFQTLPCLLNHLRVQHSPETGPGARPRHECSICGRIFRQSTHMVQHLRTHTGERPFWCRECGSRFTTSGQLQRHSQAVHQGLKRFKCDLCGKEFLYSHNYKAHLQRHEGNKGMSCDLCEKTFFTKNALFRHQRFHTGEKPFQCDICGKKFADCSNRKRHRLHHHKSPVPEISNPETALATQGPVQIVLLQQPEENATAEDGKTFTSLRTFVMEDFLHVELVTFDDGHQENGTEDQITLARPASELTVAEVQDEERLPVSLQPVDVTLHPSDLDSSLRHINTCTEDVPFSLDTIPSDSVDISTSLVVTSPVDLSPNLHSVARSPLHITPPSLRNSPSSLSPTMENNPLDLSPSLQPMGSSPLHMPSSDFLLTLHGY